MTSFDDLRRGTRDGHPGRWRDRLRPDRRTLLIGGGAAAGLAVAWAVWPRDAVPGINAAADETILGPYLKIGRDGHVTILCPQTESGQGAFTLIAQIAADELGADWRTIAVEPAPISPVYANTLFFAEDAATFAPRVGVPEAVAGWSGWRRFVIDSGAPAMLTGGSTTIRMFEKPVRDAAAIARALLCMAAAARWDVAWEECRTDEGFVIHSTRRLRFAELAEAAATHTPPEFPAYRPVDEESLAGRPLPRLDLPAKIDGSLNFAADVRLPDMAYAAIRQGPHGDTKLLRYDRPAGERVRGFISAVRHDRWLAAVATNSWAAQRALDAMAPVFRTTGTMASSAAIDRRLKAAVEGFAGTRIVNHGDARAAMAGRVAITAAYQVAPGLHAAIETRSATAQPDGNRMRVWVASDAPGFCRAAIAAALGIGETDVALFVMPGGGSFGVGLDHSVAVQAALIARAVGRPVQLSWSRAEEIIRDLPSAPARTRLSATLSSGTTIDALQIAVAVPASRHEMRARLAGARPDTARRSASASVDAAMLAGATPPYQIPHLSIDHLPVEIHLPTGQSRASTHCYNTFFLETFLDELGLSTSTEPFSFRIAMLGNAPRLARCLQTVTALGGWTGGGTGSAEGIACATLADSHIAILARARRSERGLVVNHLFAAVDCGRILNPSIVRQHIEGGLLFGLAAAIGATTQYRRGLAQARRLGQLNLPILAQIPRITIELLTSDAEPGGTEDLGVPAVAPAIANALFTTTGRRLRRLPLIDRPLP